MNKILVRRFYDEVLNQGCLDTLDTFLSADYVDHNLPSGFSPGLAGARQVMANFFCAYSDYRFTIAEMIAEGNKVAVRVVIAVIPKGHRTASGTLVSKQARIKGMDIFRIENNQLVEHWSNFDELGLIQQLGIST